MSEGRLATGGSRVAALLTGDSDRRRDDRPDDLCRGRRRFGATVAKGKKKKKTCKAGTHKVTVKKKNGKKKKKCVPDAAAAPAGPTTLAITPANFTFPDAPSTAIPPIRRHSPSPTPAVRRAAFPQPRSQRGPPDPGRSSRLRGQRQRLHRGVAGSAGELHGERGVPAHQQRGRWALHVRAPRGRDAPGSDAAGVAFRHCRLRRRSDGQEAACGGSTRSRRGASAIAATSKST